MAIAETSLSTNNWVKIGDNVTSITFQCTSQFPIVIACTSTNVALTSTAPGLVYNQYEGEIKKLVADLSFETSPTYVWAKARTSHGTVVYETP
tara:strand:+ start:504 stop:782 length:279 start_codon:yes stop_codon:yes gene_type:complete